MGQKLGIDLQPRDFAVLYGLFESRIMRLAHIAKLYFTDKSEMAKKRVQKLKAAGLIRERPRKVSDPSILFLAKDGLVRLRDEGYLAEHLQIGLANLEKRAQVSELTLKHELEVMDVKAAMVTAINRTEKYHVKEFSTWPALNAFNACKPNGERVIVRPDGFIRVQEKENNGGVSEHAFFLEVDRSTKTLDVLCQTCHCYLDYYRSGGFAVRNGARREAFKEFPFRVLLICKSAERRDNIAARLLQNNPPILTQVWLAAISDTTRTPLGEIWRQSKDYGISNGQNAVRTLLTG